MDGVPHEMGKRMLATQAELQAVRVRMAAAEQNKKVLALTAKQIGQQRTGGHVWQNVGRMFVKTSTEDFDKDVERKTKELDEQLGALQKKEVYYKTTLEKLLLTVSNMQEES